MADFITVTAQDLKDPLLLKLNRVLKGLAQQISPPETLPSADGSTPSTQRPQANASSIQGRNISTATPADGQALVWNAQQRLWLPGTVVGDLDSFSADASASLTLTTSYQAIPGATVTVTRAGTYLIDFFSVLVCVRGDNLINYALYVNGVANGNVPTFNENSGTAGSQLEVVMSFGWRLSLTAGTVLDIRAKKGSGVQSSSVQQPTTIRALRSGA